MPIGVYLVWATMCTSRGTVDGIKQQDFLRRQLPHGHAKGLFYYVLYHSTYRYADRYYPIHSCLMCSHLDVHFNLYDFSLLQYSSLVRPSSMKLFSIPKVHPRGPQLRLKLKYAAHLGHPLTSTEILSAGRL